MLNVLDENITLTYTILVNKWPKSRARSEADAVDICQTFSFWKYRPYYLNDLQEATLRVYSSIIIGKLLYAVSSWWGFASAADRQRLQARDVHGSIFQNPIQSTITVSISTHIQSNPQFILSAKTPSNMFWNLIHFCS